MITLIGSIRISLILGFGGTRMTTLKKATDTITILFKAIRMSLILGLMGTIMTTLIRGTRMNIIRGSIGTITTPTRLKRGTITTPITHVGALALASIHNRS